MIRAVEVTKAQERLLYHLLQKYLYEMSQFYADPMDVDGNFAYPWLPYYFTEERRQAYFFYDDGERVGFALVNDYSFTGEAVDNCIAEFTIFPAFRGSGRGLEAVAALRDKRPGNWQLKYSIANAAGARFWRRVGQKYGGREQALSGSEIVLSFS